MLATLKKALADLRFSRALVAVLLANLAALVILNALELKPFHLLFVYPGPLCLFWWFLHRARVRRAQAEIPGWAVAWALALFVFLTVPRLAYLLEWVPGGVVLAQFDDWGRLGELASMTLSDRYPLVHSANENYLYSHYYTPLYPMALVKMLVPALTLKDSIVIASTFYNFLLAMSLLEISSRLFSSRRSFVVFLFLCTLFGGFDWVFYANQLFAHAEHWTREVFSPGVRQISSFFTALFWVVHHTTALYSVVLALLFARILSYRARAAKPLLLGLLLINAFYSSIFTTWLVILLGFPELLWLFKRTWKTRVLPLLILVFCGPFFLYTNRVADRPLSFAPLHIHLLGQPVLDGLITCPAYLTLTSLIDLVGIPFLLLAFWRRFTRKERRYYAGSMLFFLSTYFFDSIGVNNYCMRGMFLPTFVFYYLFAKYSVVVAGQWVERLPRWRPALAVLAVVLSIGTIKEWCWMTYQPLLYSNVYWRFRGKEPPPYVTPYLLPAYRELARDRTIRFYQPAAIDRHSNYKYNAGKLIRDLQPDEMNPSERELLRYPRKSWFW
jgi:hypothetical protein